MQGFSQIITTNKATPSFFTGAMPFLSPNQQCQITEGNISVEVKLLSIYQKLSLSKFCWSTFMTPFRPVTVVSEAV